jgi:hypothetical protein
MTDITTWWILGFSAKKFRSTSSIVNGGIDTAARCNRGPLSFILSGKEGKNTDNSFSACSVLSFVVDLSVLVSGGTLAMLSHLRDPATLPLATCLCPPRESPPSVSFSVFG